jgi:hypothetical protein
MRNTPRLLEHADAATIKYDVDNAASTLRLHCAGSITSWARIVPLRSDRRKVATFVTMYEYDPLSFLLRNIVLEQVGNNIHDTAVKDPPATESIIVHFNSTNLLQSRC